MSDNDQGSSISRRHLMRRAGGLGLLLPVSGSAFSLVLSACGDDSSNSSTTATDSDSDSSEQEVLKQAFTTAFGFTMSFVPSMVAKEEGFWADEGLDIDVQGGQGSSPAIQAVVGGSADYARSNGTNIMVAIAKEDVPIISIAMANQRSQFELVSLPDSPIRSASDMDGKKIGVVSAGGATEDLVLLILAEGGVDPGSVQRPVTGVGAAALQLAKDGAVDGWIAVQSDRASIEESGETLVSVNTDDLLSMPSDAYLTTLEMTQSDSDAPTRFLAGISKAMEFASDPANAEKVIAHVRKYNPDIPVEKGLYELPMIAETWTAGGSREMLDFDANLWERGQETMIAAGKLDGAVPLDRLIESRYLDELKGR